MVSRYLIYGLIDPRDGQIRYVGQSSSGLTRPAHHRLECFLRPAEHTYKARWVRKLQRLNLDYDIVVLEELGGAEDLDIVESFWIAQLKGMGNRLTNATSGGKGNRGVPRTAEWRRKISESQKGPKGFWFGKRQSDETRLKRSRSLGGLAVIDSNGVVYPSVAEAARRTGLDESGIRSVLKGRALSVGGGANRRGQGLKFKYFTGAGESVDAPDSEASTLSISNQEN